jgi:hypothetical protein
VTWPGKAGKFIRQLTRFIPACFFSMPHVCAAFVHEYGPIHIHPPKPTTPRVGDFTTLDTYCACVIPPHVLLMRNHGIVLYSRTNTQVSIISCQLWCKKPDFFGPENPAHDRHMGHVRSQFSGRAQA